MNIKILKKKYINLIYQQKAFLIKQEYFQLHHAGQSHLYLNHNQFLSQFKNLNLFTDLYLKLIPKNIKKLNPMGVQLGLMSSQEFKIRKFCTGDVTTKSIAKSLEIDYYELLNILKKLEKNGDILLKIRKY